jgi:zinc protease
VTAVTAPPVGPPTPVRFPLVVKETMPNGLDVWTVSRSTAPVAAVLLLVNCGSASDPDDRPGLAGVTADLLDEGARDRDAIQLSEAFALLGSHLGIEVGPDVTTFGLTTLTRHLDAVIDLLGDVILRPRLDDADFARVRDLRLNRLRQLSRSASSAADRAFLEAVFSEHPYGHGALGTTPSLQAIEVEDARAFWRDAFVPVGATLIVAGDFPRDLAMAAVDRAFGEWAPGTPGPAAAREPASPPDRRVLLVDRPGASQSELRVGHGGPSRRTEAYHALVAMNAVLGGQFASRINRTLREERGVTYGARTAFEFRRAGGNFACETSVQRDATAETVEEILRQFAEIRGDGAVAPGELDRAKSSLTRGYVRNFETPVQLARAAALLATHDLPASVYEAFVPAVEAVTAADVTAAATRYVRPDDCAVVVVGDAARCRGPLERIGRDVTIVAPEF